VSSMLTALAINVLGDTIEFNVGVA